MKTINIKGKAYATVNERLKEFRKEFKDFSLESKIVKCDETICIMQAIIRNSEGRVIATGTALERANQEGSLVNKTSHVENCETSAWGRALGNLGIGIDVSIASAEEAGLALQNQATQTIKKPFTPIRQNVPASNPFDY